MSHQVFHQGKRLLTVFPSCRLKLKLRQRTKMPVPIWETIQASICCNILVRFLAIQPLKSYAPKAVPTRPGSSIQGLHDYASTLDNGWYLQCLKKDTQTLRCCRFGKNDARWVHPEDHVEFNSGFFDDRR